MLPPKLISTKGILNSAVTLPGSKSITNRALLLAALAKGKTTLTGILKSDDTQVMAEGLSQLGVPLRWNKEQCQIDIEGIDTKGGGGTFPNQHADIYVGNSGTTARFLTAVLAFSSGHYRLYGKPRMHQRPIKDLVEVLHLLGGNITYESEAGFPPLTFQPYRLEEGATCYDVSVFGSISSQYLTALLLASPLAARHADVKISVIGELVSKPYIDMTLKMMRSFGISVDADKTFHSFFIPVGSTYQSPQMYSIEPDASAASYFFAAAAVCGGSVTVQGLSKKSLQGDVAFAELLEQMGCDVRWNVDSITVSRLPEKPLKGITADMNRISDTAQTLAVVSLFAEGSTEICNIEHVRYKETDRIADLATELRRFGAAVEEKQGGLRITSPERLISAEVKTYDDHRMAMSFAVAGLRLSGVSIADPDCTQKTFPNFFEVLEGLQEKGQ